MHPNAALISRFYEALGRRDATAMVGCYDGAVEFSDEVFPDLQGDRAMAMWRMLCERGKDLRVEFRDVEADDRMGRAHWEAWYTFSATGRKVHNRIEAEFLFKNGRIIRHRDRFSFYAWAAQALGITGKLLGWSGRVKSKVRRQAAKQLDGYIGRQAR